MCRVGYVSSLLYVQSCPTILVSSDIILIAAGVAKKVHLMQGSNLQPPACKSGALQQLIRSTGLPVISLAKTILLLMKGQVPINKQTCSKFSFNSYTCILYLFKF